MGKQKTLREWQERMFVHLIESTVWKGSYGHMKHVCFRLCERVRAQQHTSFAIWSIWFLSVVPETWAYSSIYSAGDIYGAIIVRHMDLSGFPVMILRVGDQGLNILYVRGRGR